VLCKARDAVMKGRDVMSLRAYHPNREDDTPRDAGSLGLCHEVDRLSDTEAFYQFEALRAASPELQAQYRIRFAALRRRLLGNGWAA